MKKIKIISLLIASLIALGSCEDWTDVKPVGTPTTAFFWEDEEDVLAAVTAMYYDMTQGHRGDRTFGRSFFWFQSASDDFIIGRSKQSAEDVKNFVVSGRDGYISNPYKGMYKMIRKANEILLNVPNVENIDPAIKNRSLGEAYFIRGFAHFWLAVNWAHPTQGVPIPRFEDEDYGVAIPPQQPSIEDNYRLIVEDMTKAAELLPYFESYGSADYGRPHKVSAWGYILKVNAYWAQYDASKWSGIPALADKIGNEGNRSLINTGDAAQSYKSVFSIDSNWSSEYMWSVNSDIEGGNIFPSVVMENKGWGIYNGWGYFNPTLELYEEYEDNDPRRELTVMKYGDPFTFFGTQRRYFSTNSLSGFMLCKYIEPFEYGTDGVASTNTHVVYPKTSLNLSLMRYAEVLLFKSEALLMMGQNGDAPLNEVRARVGLAPITNVTMDDLKHERRCELAGEWSDRFNDLLRWKDYDKIRQPLHGRIHAVKSDPDSPYTVEEVWPARSNFNPDVHNAWPYDPDQIANSNGLLKQNPGWPE